MAVEINVSTLRQQVEEGWKKVRLAEHYGLPVAQMTQVLKDAGLRIRKFHAPKYILVDSSVEESVEDTVEVTGEDINTVESEVVTDEVIDTVEEVSVESNW